MSQIETLMPAYNMQPYLRIMMKGILQTDYSWEKLRSMCKHSRSRTMYTQNSASQRQ